MTRIYKKREPIATCSPYSPPVFAVRLAEGRMEPFVREYQNHQRFSATIHTLSKRPVPTLLDLSVSAYLQGIEDTVQMCTERKFNFSGGELDEHQHWRDRTTDECDGRDQPSEDATAKGNRRVESVTTETPATRRDGPHSGFEEFSLSMW